MPTFDRPIYPLLTNGSATGGAVSVQPGTYAFEVIGTFSGATVKLQLLGPDGTTWVDAGTEATLTAAGACAVDLPGGAVRVAISSGPPSGIYATLSPVQA